MNRCGIGPFFTIITVCYVVVAIFLTRSFPEFFLIQSIPTQILFGFGIGLLSLGALFYIWALRTFNAEWNNGKLATNNAFSIVRHPIYAAWILFIIPGSSLLFKSWLMLGTPIVSYAMFKSFIHMEDNYLKARFGQEYFNYRKEVGELLPDIRFFLRNRSQK